MAGRVKQSLDSNFISAFHNILIIILFLIEIWLIFQNLLVKNKHTD